ncbi:phenylalanine--tRNA ligase alpha subunit [Planctomycetota bacterium]|nr:phenylalanine--tRNA ligase alpha subunit [Planctomycetota bacterium]
MALDHDLESLRSEAAAAFAAAADGVAVEAARVAVLGRQGRLKDIQDAFRAAAPEDKRRLGPVLNAVKSAIESAWHQAAARVAATSSDPPIDLTLPTTRHRPGSIHPLSQVGAEIEQVFHGLGFTLEDGPHVEFDDYNFTRLNIPADHPARDAQDTFWLTCPAWNGQQKLLRTHTSSVQSRVYERFGRWAKEGRIARDEPFRRVVVGKVFRYEATDATHDHTFTQVEGFVVDRDITVAHLVGTIRALLGAVLRRDDVEVRLRPAYYPFVEPGFDVDVRCTGAGPSVRYHRWMELLGCGMIHPTVLAAGGLDPERQRGFAFGLGLERLTMIRHGITDIRVFNGADLRCLRQFAAG